MSTNAQRGSQQFLDEMAADAPPRSVGVPVKVHVHKKLHRDLTDLCLVQELQAHSGACGSCKVSTVYLEHHSQFLACWKLRKPLAEAQPASHNAQSSMHTCCYMEGTTIQISLHLDEQLIHHSLICTAGM